MSTLEFGSSFGSSFFFFFFFLVLLVSLDHAEGGSYTMQSEHIQPNFDGSNIFRTMNRCLGQGKFELLSAKFSARCGGIKGVTFRFSLT